MFHLYARPGKPARHPAAYPPGYRGSRKVYAICLSHGPSECLSVKFNGTDVLIWIGGVGDVGVWATLIWLIITNKQGRETPEDEGEIYHGKHEKGDHFHQCLDGKQSGDERAVFTTNCFGNDLASWLPRATNAPATEYNYWNYESALKAGKLYKLLATTRDKTGADVYNIANRSGLWATWSFIPEGTCNPC